MRFEVIHSVSISDIISRYGARSPPYEVSPKNFTINSEETKVIEIKATPNEYIASKEGSITFEYKIKDSKNQIQAGELTINII